MKNEIKIERWEARREPKVETVVCRMCGKPFEHDEAYAKAYYCSDECKREVRRIRDKEFYERTRKKTTLAPVECLFCGNVFVPGRVDQIYCSNKCGSNARLAMMGERERALNPESVSVCLTCGTVFWFPPFLKETPDCCSKECYRKARKQFDEMKDSMNIRKRKRHDPYDFLKKMNKILRENKGVYHV